MIHSGIFVEEYSLYGISLGTIANLLVAFGTILLAVYTYKSVKTSEKQLEILQREKEKPQALEQIPILNEIQDDLNREVGVILFSDVLWIVCDDCANSHVAPLIFPVSSRKDFYHFFRQNFFGKPILSDKKIPMLIDSIESQLHERYLHYRSLSEKMELLEKEIERKYLEKDFDALISKLTIISLRSKTVNPEIIYQISKDKQQIGEISQWKLKNIMKSLLISDAFTPVHAGDYRVKSHGFDLLTAELVTLIWNLSREETIPEISAIVESFNEELTLLRKTDQAIIRDIQLFKDIYGEKYILTGNELNPQWKNWIN